MHAVASCVVRQVLHTAVAVQCACGTQQHWRKRQAAVSLQMLHGEVAEQFVQPLLLFLARVLCISWNGACGNH